MDNRERIIRLWFDMWLTKKDLGISDIFSNNAIYIESWGPEYHGIKKIILWFEEWNTRGTVLQWDIKQFFHIWKNCLMSHCKTVPRVFHSSNQSIIFFIP